MTPERVKRVLLSLPDVGYRTSWLRSELLRLEIGAAADLLNALCEQSERSDPRAREALLTVAMLLASLGECELVERLRVEAAQRRLLSLDRLVRPMPLPVERARRADELPVPDYGVGRELTLGERRSLARRPDRRAFDRLLADPHPFVIRQLLQNPKITEDDVVRLATIRPARVEVLQEIATSKRWLCRARVRLSILFNPGSPPTLAVPLLGLCTRTELKRVVENTKAHRVLRTTARELLERRPPLNEPDEGDLVLQ
jgi:hypothetical protein